MLQFEDYRYNVVHYVNINNLDQSLVLNNIIINAIVLPYSLIKLLTTTI